MTRFIHNLDEVIASMHTLVATLEKTLLEANARICRLEKKIASSQLEGKVILPTYKEFCNSAKYCMSGEFRILGPEQDCLECGGEGFACDDDGEERECMKCDNGKIREEIPIPWTNIKEIYKRICEKYSREAN